MHGASDASALDQSVPAHALWNPSAVACWSVIFTPAFGAWLLMRNWEALGDMHQAQAARKWFVFGIGLLAMRVLSAAINTRLNSQSNLLHWMSLGYLLAWWMAAAAPQARLVRSRFGPDYPRQGWDYALLLAVLLGSAYQLVSACFTWLFVALT
jgi:hypothetical protein